MRIHLSATGEDGNKHTIIISRHGLGTASVENKYGSSTWALPGRITTLDGLMKYAEIYYPSINAWNLEINGE